MLIVVTEVSKSTHLGMVIWNHYFILRAFCLRSREQHLNHYICVMTLFFMVFVEANDAPLNSFPFITFCSFSSSRWRHQMETFSALLALCTGNSPVTGEFPAQRPVTRSFDVFFDLRINKSLSYLRRHRTRYGVTVIIIDVMIII